MNTSQFAGNGRLPGGQDHTISLFEKSMQEQTVEMGKQSSMYLILRWMGC